MLWGSMRSSGRDPDKNNICSRLVEHVVYQKAVCTTEKKMSSMIRETGEGNACGLGSGGCNIK